MGLGLVPSMLLCWPVHPLAAGVAAAAAVAEGVRLLLLVGHRLLQVVLHLLQVRLHLQEVVCAQAGLTALVTALGPEEYSAVLLPL